MTPVYLEVGKKRVFAAAIDWPGWCRSGRDEAQALEALATAAPRYALVARRAHVAFSGVSADGFEVVERLPGSATTDFGAPASPPAADAEPLDAASARQWAALVRATWQIFDGVVASSPLELRKGPRGGGRNRDKIVDHVVNAEIMYARKLCLRLPVPAPDDAVAVAAARAALADFLQEALSAPPPPGTWLPRLAARRIAWHVLDHAWEMEDKRPE
jgi:hypothetical protein